MKNKHEVIGCTVLRITRQIPGTITILMLEHAAVVAATHKAYTAKSSFKLAAQSICHVQSGAHAERAIAPRHAERAITPMPSNRYESAV